MIREQNNSIEKMREANRLDKLIQLQCIPVHILTATAGFLAIVQGSHSELIDYGMIPDAPRCDGNITIRGDSMEPELKTGNKVVFF